MRTNTITVTVLQAATQAIADTSAARFECDLVQYMKIEGIELPDVYQVDFCNVGDDETITMVGGADGVIIPDQLIQTGLPIVAYLYLQTGTDSWNTVVQISIPVMSRPERSDIQPTPAEQSTIDSLLAAMNNIMREGVGIPAGGTVGQVLTKQSDEDYDAEWENGGGGGNIVIVNFTYSARPYSLTADKTYQEVKAVIDAGGSAVAMVNHAYALYELATVSENSIQFSNCKFSSGQNNGVKIKKTVFSLLASGGCGSVVDENTYGGDYPVYRLILANDGAGFSIMDYDLTGLDPIISTRRYDFQIWLYPSSEDYYNNSYHEVYRMQTASYYQDETTQQSMNACNFTCIADNKIKNILVEMGYEAYDWGNATFTYTEEAL